MSLELAVGLIQLGQKLVVAGLLVFLVRTLFRIWEDPYWSEPADPDPDTAYDDWSTDIDGRSD